ncbi:MAG: ferrous iron transport protein B [Desulfobacterium sp.]|jgi:ferrous iron transport protein B|nr:ferrous iron transport protein B [Desulfobacterium sp.]
MKQLTIALAGNPNSGKTTIFNNLTGARQKVGNWPGVTVEKKEGIVKHNGVELKFVDLPGTYSLTPFSLEEIVARDFILNEKPDVVVNIIDAANLERSLYLAMQIMELDRPVVFALNMADLAKSKGFSINGAKLAALLDLPVVFTVGNRVKGMDELVEAAVKEAGTSSKGKAGRKVTYHRNIEALIREIETAMDGAGLDLDNWPGRWTAIKLLENDEVVKKNLRAMAPDAAKGAADEVLAVAERARIKIEEQFQDDPEIVLTDERYGFIAGIVRSVVTVTARKRADISRSIDRVLTNRFLGFPIFIFFIWAMFQMTFSFGAYPMEWIDTGVGFFSSVLKDLLPSGLLKDLMLDGIVTGIGSVIVFLPNILILFFCIALFEDTGYMARTAFLMDRIMHTVGLHGKSFIPMLMGFGCSVPAIMATKALENRKDRILTILITPFMSCSAKLPVYIVLAGSFFAQSAGTVIFGLYIMGIVIAILSGRLFRSTLLRGEDAPFVMELPPYRVPMLKSLMIHMWDRSKMFLQKMGGVILVGSIIIWALSTFPRDRAVMAEYSQYLDRVETQRSGIAAQPGTEDRNDLLNEVDLRLADLERQRDKALVERSFVGRLGHFIEPVFSPIGIDWRGGVALVTGLVAKEVVVSTMGVLYGVEDDQSDALDYALHASGMTALSALSMMVFVLLYVPCIATVTTIWREASAGWAWFSLFYTTSVAWCFSFLVYQGGKLLGFG